MQAVILAAGKGKRLGRLGKKKQKATLDLGTNLLLHNIKILEKFFDEIIIVAGHKKENIFECIKSLKDKNLKNKIRILIQKEQKGTAHAIGLTRDYIKNNFLVVFGDTMLKEEYIKKILKTKANAIAVYYVNDPWNYGVVKLRGNYVVDIIEKPKKGTEPSRLVHGGINFYDKSIFDAIAKTKLNPLRKEYEITDTYKILLQGGEKIRAVKIEKPIHITTARDFFLAKKLASLRHD